MKDDKIMFTAILDYARCTSKQPTRDAHVGTPLQTKFVPAPRLGACELSEVLKSILPPPL